MKTINTEAIFSKEPNVLWWLVAQAPGWMLPGKEDILLQGLTIEKRILRSPMST